MSLGMRLFRSNATDKVQARITAPSASGFAAVDNGEVSLYERERLKDNGDVADIGYSAIAVRMQDPHWSTLGPNANGALQ